MTTVEKLRKMRELLARPNGWTQCADARTADGTKCWAGSEYATSWCISGACIAVEPDAHQFSAERQIGKFIGRDEISIWNDHIDRTQAEVLAAIDGTIASLEE